MASYVERREKGRNPWNWKPYPGRDQVIAGVMIHATRAGDDDPEHDDGPGTENWGMHPDNRARDGDGDPLSYGTYWDALIFRDGTRVISTDWDREFASWTAGFGDAGTWAAGHYYIQVEVSQSRNEHPYSAASIDSLAQLVAAASIRYGFPIERIPYLTQTGARPRGICTHEDSANGRKSGKTDPGPQFPWAVFMAKARAYAAGEEQDEMGMTAEELARMERLERLVAGYGIDPDAEGKPTLTGEAALERADAQGYSAMASAQGARQAAAVANQRIDALPAAADPAVLRNGDVIRVVRQ